MKLHEHKHSFCLALTLFLIVVVCALALGVQTDAAAETASAVAEEYLSGKGYELTIDQAYCDGRKLYYSYLLTMTERRLEPLPGEKIAYEPWDESYPGERFETVMHTFLGDEADREVAAWLNAHEPAYIEVDHTYLADGAQLLDGTDLPPIDSGIVRVDDKTMMSYYEVELPQGYDAGEEIEFVLSVLTSTTAYYQDETGICASTRYRPEKRVYVPVTAPVTGKLEVFEGEGVADGFPAQAKLLVSDVDVRGTVRIFAPEDYAAEGYELEANGERLGSFEPMWTLYDGEAHVMQLRFDLPENMESMRLVPIDPAYAHEAIELSRQEETR